MGRLLARRLNQEPGDLPDEWLTFLRAKGVNLDRWLLYMTSAGFFLLTFPQ